MSSLKVFLVVASIFRAGVKPGPGLELGYSPPQ